MEYYIHNCPLFVLNDPVSDEVNIAELATEVEELLPSRLLEEVDVIYFGEFPTLGTKNAAYSNGAIYIDHTEPTNYDILENIVHEAAHSLEPKFGSFLYDSDLKKEFLGKRMRLKSILDHHGHKIPKEFYQYTEYNKLFDEFLANEVGYPTLLNLTMGLFVSPYGATSLQEYFANGFEKYFLENPSFVRNTSPVLYRKIEDIINEQE
jgi:hypothetical protein